MVHLPKEVRVVNPLVHDDELALMQNSWLKLWTRPDYSHIYAYRSHTIAPHGRVLDIPKALNPELLSALDACGVHLWFEFLRRGSDFIIRFAQR